MNEARKPHPDTIKLVVKIPYFDRDALSAYVPQAINMNEPLKRQLGDRLGVFTGFVESVIAGQELPWDEVAAAKINPDQVLKQAGSITRGFRAKRRTLGSPMPSDLSWDKFEISGTDPRKFDNGEVRKQPPR